MLYIGLAVVTRRRGWWLLWPAVSLRLVAAGYFGLGLGEFGKQNDRAAWWQPRVAELLLPLVYDELRKPGPSGGILGAAADLANRRASCELSGKAWPGVL